MAKKTGLGKGLNALFEDNSTLSSATEQVKVSEIEPNRNQPRQDFDQESLLQLADSIREHGVIQPLILRPIATGGYQIVAGERRFRASRMAGLSELPAVVRDLSDKQTMEIALIENLQREDLNAMEVAAGYQELIDKYDFTQDAIAKSVGKSRPAVANALRLLQLPEPLHAMVKKGALSAGHARTILALEDPAQMIAIADATVKQGLTVRALEALIKKTLAGETLPVQQQSFQLSPKRRYYKELQLALTATLGRAVEIKSSDKGKTSKLVIEFYDQDDLKLLLQQTMGEITILPDLDADTPGEPISSSDETEEIDAI